MVGSLNIVPPRRDVTANRPGRLTISSVRPSVSAGQFVHIRTIPQLTSPPAIALPLGEKAKALTSWLVSRRS
jgi:hypothetical protein